MRYLYFFESVPVRCAAGVAITPLRPPSLIDLQLSVKFVSRPPSAIGDRKCTRYLDEARYPNKN